jgi:hypothetical protein
MRPSSNSSRVAVQGDGILPFPHTITYSIVFDYECPRCQSKTSVVDDSQVYVRRKGLAR